ncbi:uncharacterized protein LOC129794752 [Lutzomyia longipalpis]|uniref:uncharacterized protein LOC129794752 n=1 Tax=Lutzomyia longipalpis TaxID=7200 RepID=UPI002483CD97|nr:uncharacterized protein LOC129794752 [Lutzomyia longipalpis]
MDLVRRKSAKPSLMQKKIIFEFMRSNPQFRDAKLGKTITQEERSKKWEQLGKRLNEVEGARKTWAQWRKVWQDMRSSLKLKYLQDLRKQGGEVEELENDGISALRRLLGNDQKALLEMLGLKRLKPGAPPPTKYRKRTRKKLDDIVVKKKESQCQKSEKESLVLKEEPNTSFEDTYVASDPEDDPIATADDAFSDLDEAVQMSPHRVIFDEDDAFRERLGSMEQDVDERKESVADEPSPLVRIAQELMKTFKEQAEAEEKFRQEQLRLMREQTEAIKSIANSLQNRK